jgi:hypothetical protein
MGKRPEIMEVREFKRLAYEVGTPPTEPVRLTKDCVSEIKEFEERERVLEFTISTGTVDRDQDTIAVDGWDLDAFLKNPVVLFAHSYDSLPVAKALMTGVEGDRLRSRAEFTPRDLYPFGYLVYEMYRQGFMRAASVGFRPIKWSRNEERGGFLPTDFLRQELLEWSCLPVPANPEALMAAKAAGLDMAPMVEWAEKVLDGHHGAKGLWIPRHVVEEIHDLLAPAKAISIPDGTPPSAQAKGVIPADVSRSTAGEDEEWSAPTLSDFTEETWDDLDDAEKRKIAGHFAWAESSPPETYGGLKLPHHRPSDGKIVWRGVAAAMTVLLGARGGIDLPDGDRPKAHSHLASHYRQFGKEPPELRDAEDDEGKRVASADPRIPAGTKSGRVLSGANEDRLRRARDLLDEVLGQLDAADEDEDEDGKTTRATPVLASDVVALETLVSRLETVAEKLAAVPAAPHTPEKAPGPEFILELADDPAPDEATIEVQTLRDTIRETIQRGVQEIRQAITGRLPG